MRQVLFDKKRNFVRILSVFVGAAWLATSWNGCANRWREADSGRSADEVMSFLGAIVQNNGTSTGLQKALAMANDPASTVYYAEAPGEMGPIEAVTPLETRFLNPQVTVGSIDFIQTWFIVLPMEDGSLEASFVVAFTTPDQPQASIHVFNSTAPAAINGGEDGDFEIALVKEGDSSTQIVTRTFDVSGENLADVIQLQIFLVDGSEEGVPMGQISSMEGF